MVIEQWQQYRTTVRQFAFAMEGRLRENDHKGGWQESDWRYLMARLREEIAELEDAHYHAYPKAEISREAADVANFAMMIADVFGDLDHYDHVHTTAFCDHVCDSCPQCNGQAPEAERGE